MKYRVHGIYENSENNKSEEQWIIGDRRERKDGQKERGMTERITQTYMDSDVESS